MKSTTRRIAAGSKWPVLAIFALLVCALVLAACGGGGSSSSSESTAATEEPAEENRRRRRSRNGRWRHGREASGEPIVTMTYTDVNTEGPPVQEHRRNRSCLQEWINSHGGIGGRPLEAKFCDARGTRRPLRPALVKRSPTRR